MQFINYFFASIFSFLGLLAGILLVKIAPEEQKPLGKYFLILRRAVFILIFIFVLFFYVNDLFFIAVLSSYLLFWIFTEFRKVAIGKKTMFDCSILGVVFFMSSKNMNLVLIVSVLVFIFGMVTSSILFNKKEKNYFEIFLKNSGFLILSILLYLI